MRYGDNRGGGGGGSSFFPPPPPPREPGGGGGGSTRHLWRCAKERNRALVRWWLYVVLLVLFALFVVGGATRLTGSGLSITEWQPIHGVIPAAERGQWLEELEK